MCNVYFNLAKSLNENQRKGSVSAWQCCCGNQNKLASVVNLPQEIKIHFIIHISVVGVFEFIWIHFEFYSIIICIICSLGKLGWLSTDWLQISFVIWNQCMELMCVMRYDSLLKCDLFWLTLVFNFIKAFWPNSNLNFCLQLPFWSSWASVVVSPQIVDWDKD